MQDNEILNGETLELTASQANSLSLVKLNVTDTEIEAMETEYLPLTIAGIDDKIGFKKVYEARQLVKKTRTGVLKYAGELKESALAWQRRVNAEKDRIVKKLEAIEGHLQAQEEAIAAAKEKIRQEEEKAKEAKIQARIDRLRPYGFTIDIIFLKTISDSDFEKVIAQAAEVKRQEDIAAAEQKRLADERELEEKVAAELEAKKIAEERYELEALRAQQEAAQKIIDDAAQKVIDDQRRADEEKRIAENLKIKEATAAEIAKRQAEEKLAQATDQAKFKILTATLTSIKIPEMKSRKARTLAGDVERKILALVQFINESI